MVKDKSVVPVVADSSSGSSANSEVTLYDLWQVIWDGKYLIISITATFTVIAIIYALLATEWYRADALLVPADGQDMSGLDGQLGGLASLAGISIGGGGENSSEAIAVLRSREFARAFLLEFELMPVFLDAAGDSEELDMRDAVRFYHENILHVSEDRDTGYVTLSVEWTDPDTAAEWANTLVNRINARMRERALIDAQTNINFLRAELASNTLVGLEQSIGRLMEAEMKKLMLVRGNEEYSFRIIDKAESPQRRSRPKRTLLVASVIVVSGIFSLLVVFVRNAVRKQPAVG